jgi:hypothetical protein
VLIRSLESQGLHRLYPIPEPTASTSTKKSSTSININNHKKELKKLNHSILIAYLDLLEILVKAPNTQIQIEQSPPPLPPGANPDEEPPKPIIIYKTLREQKLEDMELLFIHMHHLINELRPHQARDNIRCILEMQKQQRAETARKFKAHLFRIMNLLRTCIQSVNESVKKSEPSPIFMDDLNSLMNDAGRLTQALDRFDTTGSTKKKLMKLTNGASEQLGDDDVEMKSEYVDATEVTKSFGKKCNITHSISNTSNNNNSNRKLGSSDNWNCEANDLILCNMIDEFLVKEN